MEVRHAPGHAPGHVIFYHPPSAVALVGDVVFHGSIGRTDLPGGDFDALGLDICCAPLARYHDHGGDVAQLGSERFI